MRARVLPARTPFSTLERVRRTYSSRHRQIFQVISRRADQRYTVVLLDNPVRAVCNCTAGRNQRACWHAVLVLKRRAQEVFMASGKKDEAAPAPVKPEVTEVVVFADRTLKVADYESFKLGVTLRAVPDPSGTVGANVTKLQALAVAKVNEAAVAITSQLIKLEENS